ncbi:hypothetical protein JYU34_014287 [Plutella xylostella]|uniref:RanBP2-type domain-containing protein n=1 Tax=Plutella xylostella TaxID=51655 RepID=A0ABQ7Q825_PLUXY|nr:hypothetical protein JYU34_014287 [Plutella xylostella]
MVMTASGASDALRERLPVLWRAIEDAHYSYLETDDSPEKIQQRTKLEGYIMEYLSLVPHECKFGLAETGKVFQRTIDELPDFNAYRAGLGWAALARYAANLLAQPWRKEYKTLRLYSGYYKHEIEANMVGAESLLQALGYRAAGGARMSLRAPPCPDMVAAVSRDALIAHCECAIMCRVWERLWGGGARVTWADVARERARPNSNGHYGDGSSEIYSNVHPTVEDDRQRLPEIKHHPSSLNHHRPYPDEEPIVPMIHPPYMVPTTVAPNMMYQMPQMHPDVPVTLPQCNPVPMMTPYGPVPYYYPVQAPYMMQTPVYAPIKHATNIPVNGYPPAPQYRYPAVPTGQLIELDSPSVYENGKYDRHRDDDKRKKARAPAESSRRNSTSKSGFSDVSLPSLPRSDTQPALSKAREDGMGTYESWDYVFRNLSSKDQDVCENRSRYSPSLDRDSRTLDRLDRDERRSKYQPTTLDLEDGLQALTLDRSYDDEVYRTAKVNENLMRLKQEQESKRVKHVKKQVSEERKKKPPEPIGNPVSDGLIKEKTAADKIRLLNKKDVKERKEVLKLQNGSASTAEMKRVKKTLKSVSAEGDKPVKKSLENGHHSAAHSSRNSPGPSNHQQSNSFDLKTHLVVSLDDVDSRRSPPKPSQPNGDFDTRSVSSQHRHTPEVNHSGDRKDKWECGTCTYLNKGAAVACEMCGKSKRGPEIQPLTSGGRECPACTLVNKRDARSCDACGTSLDHCPTYI